MNTRTAKTVTMTTMAGVEIACDAVKRTVDVRRPSVRRKYVERAPAPDVMAGLYRVAELRYRDLPREPLPGASIAASDVHIRTSLEVAHVLRMLYGGRTVEFFGAIALNTRNRILGHTIVGQGSVSYAPVSMSELARFLCLSGAASFIVFHNHPSESLEWSDDDIAITKRIASVGHILGVRLVDHLLLTTQGHVSMLDQGHSDLLKPDAER